jgi:atypical dual specificity phosphatase
MSRVLKPTTTVAMDMGIMQLGDDRVVLYGAPGQDRFDFMWDILLQQSSAAMLVLDHSAVDPVADLARYHAALSRRRTQQLPLVIGVTHVDRVPDRPLVIYEEYLGQLRARCGCMFCAPVQPMDARNRSDVGAVLAALAALLEVAQRVAVKPASHERSVVPGAAASTAGPAPGNAVASRTLRGLWRTPGPVRIDLDLPRKGVTVPLGPSGTGKSTLLRTVAAWSSTSRPPKSTERSPTPCPTGPPLVMQKAACSLSSVLENLVQGWSERASLTAGQQQAHAAKWLASLDQERLAQQLHTPVVELPLPEQRLVSVLRVPCTMPPAARRQSPPPGSLDSQAEGILAVLRRLGQRRALLRRHASPWQSGPSPTRWCCSPVGASRSTPRATPSSAPSSESGRQFLRSGSCPEEPLHPHPCEAAADAEPIAPDAAPREAPAATVIRPRTLGPNGFAWLIPYRLAGTPWPGLVRPPEYDLDLLRDLGITRLLSLTNRSVDASLAAAYGMAVANEPIVDMQPPGIEQAMRLCARIERWLGDAEVVAVHCRAGLGRTGTVLGAFRIWQQSASLTGAQALQDLRRLHPGWVQSASQIDFLQAFATAVARMKTGGPSQRATETVTAPGP